MSKTLEQRFWEKVDKSPGQGPDGDCWLWIGSVSKNRGLLKSGDTTVSAHRYSYEINIDYLEYCNVVGQSCGCSLCVRPEHLVLKTKSEVSNVKKSQLSAVEKKYKAARDAARANGYRKTEKDRTKLTDKTVLLIRKLSSQGHSYKAISVALDLSYSRVESTATGRRHNAVTPNGRLKSWQYQDVKKGIVYGT